MQSFFLPIENQVPLMVHRPELLSDPSLNSSCKFLTQHKKQKTLKVLETEQMPADYGEKSKLGISDQQTEFLFVTLLKATLFFF